MNQFPQRIQEMLTMRQLEEIGPNPNHALTVIATAQTHIKTAFSHYWGYRNGLYCYV